MQRSLLTTTNAAGKFWTHAKVEHAQGLDFTSLYPANTGGDASWVKGKRYGLVVERGKTYFGVPTQALLGEISYWDDILPKRSNDELEPQDACHEG